MALPTIRKPTVAPSRKMARDVYPIVADEWAASIGPFTEDLIAAITWMGNQVTDVASFRDQAAASAKAAAQSVSDAAAQVKLATDQAVASKGSADAAARQLASTETVAAAVRAQINLPSLAGQKGKFWQVSDDEKTLQLVPLIVNRVGDVVVSLAPPDATFILDDTRYFQSLWPELYAKMGAIGFDVMADASKVNNAPGTSITNMSNTSPVVLGLLNDTVFTGDAAGQIFNLVNATASTTLTYKNPNGYAYNGGATDDKGTFIFCGNSGTFARSTDNGATWVNLSMPAGTTSYNWYSIATDGKGTWYAFTNSNGVAPLKSTNNGASWQSVTLASMGLPTSGGILQVSHDGVGAWYVTQASGTQNIYKSTDGGATWPQLANQPPLASVVASNVAPSTIYASRVAAKGNFLVCSNTCVYPLAGSTYYAMLITYSYDGGATWQQIFATNPSPNSGPIGGEPVIGGDNTVFIPDINRPYYAFTVKNINAPRKTPAVTQLYINGISGNYFKAATNGFGTWYIVTSNSYKKITPTYDAKTQFYVPKFTDAPFPFYSYVKARTLV